MIGSFQVQNFAPAQGRQSLADTVASSLAKRIASGELRPGDVIPSVSDLAQQFSVSRPVVREALLQLSGKGVLEIRQGRSTRVCAPSSAPLQELLDFTVLSSEMGFRDAIELRRTLEPQIAALAAVRASYEDLEEVEAAFHAMEKAAGTIKPWVKADLQFHLALAKASKNTLMYHLVEAIRGVIYETMRLRRENNPKHDPRGSLDRHKRILDRVMARDAEGARAAVEDHSQVSPNVFERIGKQP